MVTKNTRKNREQLSLRSTDFAQAHPFGTLVSDQDTSSNNVLTSHPVSRRMVLKTGLGAAVAATGIGTWLGLHANATHAFFLGNAAIQWDNAVLQAIRNIGVGPTVASRAIAITHTSMYDAWATYDAVAVPTRPNGIGRQAGKYSDATMAVSYAAYRALLDLFPSQASLFTTQMNAMGFDPSNTSTDTTTQVGVGNVAAKAVIAFRHTDGSNQLGNDPNGTPGIPYSDTSGYVPVNTPTTINDPTRWQPLSVPNGNGGFVVQKYLTPHWGTVIPFALTSGSQFRPSGPVRDATSSAYKSQADQILQYSANLNDQTKTIADYWANGPHTETPPGHWDVFAQFYIAQFLSLKYKHDLNHDVKMFFALSNALFDAGIACWECKRAYDYVRPITAVHYLYPYPNKVTAWAGYGKGTQSIYGRDWMPFQEPTIVTPPFPEYVSGHSTFSAAGAYILRQVTGFDLFIDSYLAEPGSSHIEPGITPMLAVVLYWPTLSSAADEAGLSRRYGGIHFQQGDLGGRTLGQQVAANGWSKAQSYFNGTVTGNDNDD